MDTAINQLFRILNCRIAHLSGHVHCLEERLSHNTKGDKKYQNELKKYQNELKKYQSSTDQAMNYLRTQMDYNRMLINQLQSQMYVLQQYISNYSPYSGHANNLANPGWGATGTYLRRKATPPAYKDGSNTLAERGSLNPNPRVISNTICRQTSSDKNTHNLADMVWIWGQFLDHELDLTEPGGTEDASMMSPANDPVQANAPIPFSRSKTIPNSDPREHPNEISAYIDGGLVYGASIDRAYALRLLNGTGKLKTNQADNGEEILPYNTFGLPNAKEPPTAPDSDFFISGDIRANENIYLTSMHTLFFREHNRCCDEIVKNEPAIAGLDEVIFQRARKKVNALLQHITYDEFLPCLLGTIPPYSGYDNQVDSSIFTEFSTACYRLGHSMLSSSLKTDNVGTTIMLRDAFFSPSYIQTNGVDNLIYGGTDQLMEKIDGKIVEDVRSFLFGPPSMTHLLDLAALNIQRGRDHGLPDYNSIRKAYGLTTKTTFSEITSNATVASDLSTLYGGDIDVIDPWVGAIVEDHHNGLPVGELVYTVLLDQFLRLRNGDRFWYENNQFTPTELAEIKATRLKDVVERNTKWTNLRDNLFKLP